MLELSTLAIRPLEDPTDPEPTHRPKRTDVQLITVIGDLRGHGGCDLVRQADVPEASRRVTRATFGRFLRTRGLQFEAPLAEWDRSVPLYISSFEDLSPEALCAQLESAVYIAPAMATRAVEALRRSDPFRACEGLCRTVHGLLEGAPDSLIVELLEATPDDLVADFTDASSVQRSDVWRAFHRSNHPAMHPRPELVVLMSSLSMTGAHDVLLPLLSDLAWRANLPVLAVADPVPAGATESAAVLAWRQTEAASWVGLGTSSVRPAAGIVARRLVDVGWGGPLDRELVVAAGRGADATQASFSVSLLVSRIVNELYDIHLRRAWPGRATEDADVAMELEAGINARLGRELGPLSVRTVSNPRAQCELELSFTVPGEGGDPSALVTRRIRIPVET